MADKLPVEIALDIFSRLQAETVFTCKRVCKTWNKFISNLDYKKNFAKMHLQQLMNHHRQPDPNNNGDAFSKVSLGLIFVMKSEKLKPTGHPLYYGEYDGSTSVQTLRKINHPPIRTKHVNNTDLLVGSCNGLICLAETRRRNIRDPVHVCNPITKECLYLPGCKEDDLYRSAVRILSGFGYSAQTNEYKVVRIFYHDFLYNHIGHIQVYTLGCGNGWRSKGKINSYLSSGYGVFANGALHWLDPIEKKIMAFNLSDEEFHVLPSGPFIHPNYYKFSFLRSWGETLLYGVGFKNDCLDIWSFKNTSSERRIDTSTTTASTYSEYDSCSWFKEFSITRGNREPGMDYVPFAVTKSGSIILWYGSIHTHIINKLHIYNPKAKSLTPLGDGDLNSLEVIPHTNSFVSLKDLGETTCKKRKLGSGVKDRIKLHPQKKLIV